MSIASINCNMLTWARERALLSQGFIAGKMGKKVCDIAQWESGEKTISFSDARQYAALVHVPFTMLYLKAPASDELPIPDRRTIGSRAVPVSPELRETLADIRGKQEWYREYALMNDAVPVELIGRFTLRNSVDDVANYFREALSVTVPPKKGTWTTFFSDLVRAIEELGILVMKNGVVRNNARRPLSIKDFRGFCLSDPIAPLIFINTNDPQQAQLFTLMHELAHLSLGQTAVPDHEADTTRAEERFCNAVAAEYLTPEDAFIKAWDGRKSWQENIPPLADWFRVSLSVAVRRALTLNYISTDDYHNYTEKLHKGKTSGSPSYYRVQKSRLGTNFASAVVSQALEGKLLLRDAWHLTGIKPHKLAEFAHKELNL